MTKGIQFVSSDPFDAAVRPVTDDNRCACGVVSAATKDMLQFCFGKTYFSEIYW